MIFTLNIFIILLFVLLICLLGFKKYIWFISIGYGFSISIIGLMLLILFRDSLDIYYVLSSLILILYGLRLGLYLLLRELKSKNYNKKMKKEIKNGKDMKLSIKIIMWISCGILYLIMCSPIIYRFTNNTGGDICLIIGLIISLIGIIIESISDHTKKKSKEKNPNKFCNDGLFKLVRCPNYLGEIIMWSGIFISGFTSLNIIQLIISFIGYIGIIYIMFSGARRLEIRQNRTYKDDKEYIKYSKTTPILIPFIPLYSVEKYKWLVG